MRNIPLALLGLLTAACGVSTIESSTGAQSTRTLNGDGLEELSDAGRSSCRPGDTKVCETSCGSPGTRRCLGGEYWETTCTLPDEICGNGVDDDCDGLVDGADDGCWSCAPGKTRICTTGCASTGSQTCETGGHWPSACLTPAEVCGNGIDDDCDGRVDAADESCWTCTPGQSRNCTTPCGSTGTQSCESGGRWPSSCLPPVENCGNGVDDDCDGRVDSAEQSCWACTPGQSRNCTTSCGSTGTQSCEGDGQWPTYCKPPPEICNDGVDDDCDGAIDSHDFDCPGTHHPCEDVEGHGCNGDMGYGDRCSAADNTGGCSAGRFWAWCNRRNTVYGDIWDNWVHDWVSTRCDRTTTLSGNTFSCTNSVNEIYECTTPLVLVFDGAPVRYRPGGSFAFTAADPVSSDWPTVETPWLVRDLDGNGRIDDGSELFGSGTRLPDGSLARDGFQALAALDSNGDGVLDARDPAFSSLRLWNDADGDQRTRSGELTSLARRGVTSLSLGFQVLTRCDAHGNCERERSAFRWVDADGSAHTGALVDIWLATRKLPRLVCAARP